MHPLEFMERAKEKTFRSQLMKDPNGTLKSVGLDVGESTVKLVSNTADVIHIPMPPDPNEDIQDSDLGEVSGGGFFSKLKIKASSLGSALSTASSADVLNTRGKNTTTVKAKFVDADTGETVGDTEVTAKLPKGGGLF